MSSIEIKSIRVHDLLDFHQEYSRLKQPGDLIPISYLRAFSQIHNPHAHGEDIGLLIALQGRTCIGYLGVLPGQLNVFGDLSKVYFSSTAYVPDSFRRSGAGLYLARAFRDIQGDLVGCDNRPRAERLWRGFDRVIERSPLRVFSIPVHLLKSEGADLDYFDIRAATVSDILELPEWKPNCKRVGFFRDQATLAWFVQNPWICTEEQASNKVTEAADLDYYFGLGFHGIKILPFLIKDKKTGEHLGLQLFSLVFQSNPNVTVLKMLDSIFNKNPSDGLLWALAGQVARNHGADKIAVDESMVTSLSPIKMMQVLGCFRNRSYFLLPRSEGTPLAKAADHLQCQLADGDAGFT